MIRLGKKEDLDQIEDLVSRAKVKMKQEGNKQWGDTYPTREHYAQDLENRELYVYELDGRVVGVACLSDEGHHEYKEINWTDDQPYLCMKRLAVDPNVHGQGIGHQFYQFIEELASKMGVSYVRTDTNKANKAAIRLFEKGNYKLVDERKHGDFKEAFCYYEKKVVYSES